MLRSTKISKALRPMTKAALQPLVKVSTTVRAAKVASPAFATAACPNPAPPRALPPLVEALRSDGSRAYAWIDAEAEKLIARAYGQHSANSAHLLPRTNLTTEELEAIGAPIHYAPKSFVDNVAFCTMRFLRIFTHMFFRKKYDHHAVVLETVAAVPGIVGAMFRHLRSLRRMERDNGWIAPLQEEAENERMHLLIWLAVVKPTALERFLIILAQGGYMAFYAFLYIFSERSAHRMVGYLEEEAHAAYTAFLGSIDAGEIPNRDAPKIAIKYYNLPSDAKLRDVVLRVRADEAMHRDFNHMLADKHCNKDADSAPYFMAQPSVFNKETKLN